MQLSSFCTIQITVFSNTSSPSIPLRNTRTVLYSYNYLTMPVIGLGISLPRLDPSSEATPLVLRDPLPPLNEVTFNSLIPHHTNLRLSPRLLAPSPDPTLLSPTSAPNSPSPFNSPSPSAMFTAHQAASAATTATIYLVISILFTVLAVLTLGFGGWCLGVFKCGQPPPKQVLIDPLTKMVLENQEAEKEKRFRKKAHLEFSKKLMVNERKTARSPRPRIDTSTTTPPPVPPKDIPTPLTRKVQAYSYPGSATITSPIDVRRFTFPNAALPKNTNFHSVRKLNLPSTTPHTAHTKNRSCSTSSCSTEDSTFTAREYEDEEEEGDLYDLTANTSLASLEVKAQAEGEGKEYVEVDLGSGKFILEPSDSEEGSLTLTPPLFTDTLTKEPSPIQQGEEEEVKTPLPPPSIIVTSATAQSLTTSAKDEEIWEWASRINSTSNHLDDLDVESDGEDEGEIVSATKAWVESISHPTTPIDIPYDSVPLTTPESSKKWSSPKAIAFRILPPKQTPPFTPLYNRPDVVPPSSIPPPTPAQIRAMESYTLPGIRARMECAHPSIHQGEWWDGEDWDLKKLYIAQRIEFIWAHSSEEEKECIKRCRADFERELEMRPYVRYRSGSVYPVEELGERGRPRWLEEMGAYSIGKEECLVGKEE